MSVYIWHETLRRLRCLFTPLEKCIEGLWAGKFNKLLFLCVIVVWSALKRENVKSNEICSNFLAFPVHQIHWTILVSSSFNREFTVLTLLFHICWLPRLFYKGNPHLFEALYCYINWGSARRGAHLSLQNSGWCNLPERQPFSQW